jgi:isopenicillin N synthase-like dioxygenase
MESKQIISQNKRDGLGILIVKNIPKYKEYRQNLLTLAKKFGELDEKTKSKYEDANSHYSFGWSFGKEKFAGKFDTSKGSYYNNPQYDKPTDDKELIKKYPFYCAGNVCEI